MIAKGGEVTYELLFTGLVAAIGYLLDCWHCHTSKLATASISADADESAAPSA
jgi:hypothetical protein